MLPLTKTPTAKSPIAKLCRGIPRVLATPKSLIVPTASLLLVAALAGCVASGSPPQAFTSSPPAVAHSHPGVNASQGPSYHRTPLNFSGQTPTGVCVGAVTTQCVFHGGLGYEQRLSWIGNASSVAGTVTTTGSTDLIVILYAGDGSASFTAMHAVSPGPSPQQFYIRLGSEKYQGTNLTLGIYAGDIYGTGLAPAGVMYSLQEDFSVTAIVGSHDPKRPSSET